MFVDEVCAGCVEPGCANYNIGYSAIAAVATAFFILNVIIGYLYGPRSQGKSLEEVLRDFYGGKIP